MSHELGEIAIMMENVKIYVAGHQGLVGSAVVRRLSKDSRSTIVVRTRSELDLLDPKATHAFFQKERPSHVILAAAKVGGIEANRTQQADFLYENLMIAANVIHAAAAIDVSRLLFLGSSCIYPKFAAQPLREDALLTGALEPTNEGYAIAKIAGLKLCEFYKQQYGKDFISAMPTNLYGPGDQFHPLNSHVIPGMMRRFHEAKVAAAKQVSVWGSGVALREFLHVDDLADALVFLLDQANPPQLTNIGSGQEVSIKQLAEAMKEVVGFKGEITWDLSKSDGTPRKLLDCSQLNQLGWKAQIPLVQGLVETYRWAVANRVFE